MNIRNIKQRSGDAFLYEENGIKVASLYGSWKEMGRQYGALCTPYLKNVYQFVCAHLSDERKAEEGRKVAEQLYAHYPYRFKAFFAGMAETSQMSLAELKLVNAVEYMEACYFCSGLAVWGDYAKGPLVYGRNYDGASFASLCENLMTTVFHPSDGSLAFAIVGYAGVVYCVNGFNEKGLFIELNNGMPTVGFDLHHERFASTTILMTLLMDADSIAYADAFFHTENSFGAFLIGVADEKEARCYEWSSDADVMRRGSTDTPDGLMCMTNHYVNKEWKYAAPDDEHSWLSHTRRNNMLHLAEIRKGKIDSPVMCDIMQTPIEAGGPLHRLSLYQIVYEPASMKLNLRSIGATPWTELNLQDFFNARP